MSANVLAIFLGRAGGVVKVKGIAVFQCQQQWSTTGHPLNGVTVLFGGAEPSFWMPFLGVRVPCLIRGIGPGDCWVLFD